MASVSVYVNGRLVCDGESSDGFPAKAWAQLEAAAMRDGNGVAVVHVRREPKRKPGPKKPPPPAPPDAGTPKRPRRTPSPSYREK